MKTTITLLCAAIILSLHSFGQVVYTKVLTDLSGDGNHADLLDGTDFHYGYDRDSDSIYFRVSVSSMNSTQSMAVGLNILAYVPGGGSTFQFWGHDNQDNYNRLITTWVLGNPPSTYSGTIGIANAQGVNSQQYTNLIAGQIGMHVSQADKYILIGLPRKNLVPDNLLVNDELSIGIAAAVGSNIAWNDDLYEQMAEVTIYKNNPDIPSGINDISHSEEIKLFPNPVSDQLNIETNERIGSVSIYNSNGKLVFFNSGDLSKTMAADFLTNGVYHMRLTNEEGKVFQTRFVKQ